MCTAGQRELVVDGCTLRFQLLGEPTGRRVVLLHGGAAHAGWWDDVAQLLTDRLLLLIPDFSGHGDSGHRDRYSAPGWADEIASLASHMGWPDFSIVGHSMGGKVGIVAAARHADCVEQLVLVDSVVRAPHALMSASPPADKARRSHKTYATLADALARFVLRPGPSVAAPETLQRLARRGLRQTPDGWTWKFDPASRRRISDAELFEALTGVRCPVAMVYGANSPSVDVGTINYLEERLAQSVLSIKVEDAYHHVPVDQPRACADAVLTALDGTS